MSDFFQKKKLKAEERENLTKFIKTAEWPLDTELEKNTAPTQCERIKM